MGLNGTEIAQVLGQDANGYPAAARANATTQQIANLAGNGKYRGTFTINGTSNVTVSNTLMTTSTPVVISLNTVGGTVGAIPVIKTISPGVNFVVAGTASDTSTYNYAILGS